MAGETRVHVCPDCLSVWPDRTGPGPHYCYYHGPPMVETVAAVVVPLAAYEELTRLQEALEDDGLAADCQRVWGVPSIDGNLIATYRAALRERAKEG